MTLDDSKAYDDIRIGGMEKGIFAPSEDIIGMTYFSVGIKYAFIDSFT